MLLHIYRKQGRIFFIFIGTKDSSGMRIWYTSSPREYDAGIFEVGYYVHPYMVIPPNAKNFTITGVSLDDCTTKVSAWKSYIWRRDMHLFYSIYLRMAFMYLQTYFIHILLVSEQTCCNSGISSFGIPSQVMGWPCNTSATTLTVMCTRNWNQLIGICNMTSTSNRLFTCHVRKSSCQ